MPTARDVALLGLGWLVVLAATPTIAYAQSGTGAETSSPSPRAASEPDDREQAQALFNEARTLVESGKFAEACPKFQRSLSLSDGLGTRFNLADCLERWGKTASALELFVEVAEATRRLGDPERAAIAQERAEGLEPRLTRLVVELPSKTPDVDVSCDGEPIPRALLGKAVPIDPGDHRVDVAVAGVVVWTVRIGVPEEAQTFSVAVPAGVFEKKQPASAARVAEPRRAVEATPPVTSDEGPSEPDTSRQAVALALGGLGVVGLIGGGAMGLQYLASQDDAKGICRGTPQCTEGDVARHRELVSDARTGKTWAIVGLSVGGAALLGAGLLYLTMPDTAAPDESALTFHPLLDPDAFLGGSVRGRF